MGRAFVVRQVSMEKTAAAKSKVNSKYGKAIYACAKSGGADPIANLSLQQLIDKAKRDQVPAHVIQKALDKSVGAAGEDFSPARYEGFGPGGFMVIVDCLTDNPKRTIQDVRNAFTKSKSKIGGPGTVAHMFDHQAVFGFSGNDDEVILEALMMADVDVTDVEVEEGKVSVFVPPTEYFKAKTALTDAFSNIKFEVDEITFIPQTDTEISGDDVILFEKFMNLLDNAEDVQNIYHNAVIKR
ncbi:YebC/PmpR family DNA-binding transcriptional regulator [Pseudoalteromonas denitrificans]|uniref:Probable transcriptional regulatory protein SAMN02745724_04337 n=1 Tax=Pseudoalteromonas denitrificans DSM 6059 TaxID=1123010 RepID=A0A1I1RTV9_9GAMM|nr:YebC/PmpR family DNA-binding transcriptional regulator [Pseudoalteromonas denitrificans]SFD37492.1 DNA-binding regulatory protein, YebC/PmpR family [Pseudoalteromonas denitrificans DSM 6059]